MSSEHIASATWAWTTGALDALDEIRKAAEEEAHRAVTLDEKLAAKNYAKRAIDGRRVVAEIFAQKPKSGG